MNDLAQDVIRSKSVPTKTASSLPSPKWKLHVNGEKYNGIVLVNSTHMRINNLFLNRDETWSLAVSES